MMKIIAIINVVAWSGFWAFGYLAFSANVDNESQMTMAAVCAAIGAGIGIWTYLQLVRHAEATGYATRANRADLSHQEELNGERV